MQASDCNRSINEEQRERNTLSWPHCGQVRGWAMLDIRRVSRRSFNAEWSNRPASQTSLSIPLPALPATNPQASGTSAPVQSITDRGISVKRLGGSAPAERVKSSKPVGTARNIRSFLQEAQRQNFCFLPLANYFQFKAGLVLRLHNKNTAPLLL